MDQSKVSTDLFLAMNVPDNIRQDSVDLNVGYDELFDEWELIIRYTGNLDNISEELNVNIEELLGGYAIARVPRFLISRLSEYPQIDYIEKPKSLLTSAVDGVNASCVARVRLPDYNLTGRGVLISVVDSGVDYSCPDFMNEDGTTRIERIWDQTIPGNPPEGFRIGSEYTMEDINEALNDKAGVNAETSDQAAFQMTGQITNGVDKVLEFDSTGHGTAVLGIAAGNGRESDGRYEGMAPEAGIVVVKMGNVDERGFPRTTQLMLAVDYSIRYAESVGKPVAVNISYGNNYGAHNGDSILERYLDTVANMYRTAVVVGAGNEGITSRHASGMLTSGDFSEIEINAGEYLTSFNIQIWKSFQDDIDIYIDTPYGRRIGPFSDISSVQSYTTSGNVINAYYGMPTPYNSKQEIYISVVGQRDYVTPGIWKVFLDAGRIVSGEYDMWLPVAGSTTAEVAFVRPDMYNTLTIPSTARYVISVAAYNSATDSYAAFSGRGVNAYDVMAGKANGAKPDIVAPGVSVISTKSGCGYGEFTGTSFAVPYVTGAAALLMQYGIVDGNDRYLYGEKLKAAIIRGARPLTAQQFFPSPLLGWGALCVSDSLS